MPLDLGKPPSELWRINLHMPKYAAWIIQKALEFGWMPEQSRSPFVIEHGVQWLLQRLAFRNESLKLKSQSRKTVPLQEDTVPAGKEIRPVDEQAALHEAIEKLYATFAKYPLLHPVLGCPHCVFKDDQERIASKELRQLDSSDLEKFAWKAMTTWGGEDDFKHFLPSILELIVSDEREQKYLLNCSVIFGKLNYCKVWSEQEQEAITNYLLAYWRLILVDRPEREGDCWEAGVYLEDVADRLGDITPYLNIWREMLPAPSSLRHLAAMIYNHSCPWKSRLIQNEQIWAWLCEDSTKEMLEEGFYAYMDEDWVKELSLAVDMLELWRNILKRC